MSSAEQTTNYLRCRYAPYGCPWLTRWAPGDEENARGERDVHHRVCLFRFHARHEE